jgi:hypothetical protein
VKLTATSNVAGTLAINGPVKRTTAQLTPNMPVLIRVPQKKKVLRRLEGALNNGKKAKLNIQGTLTDRSAATAADSVKVKFKP